MLDKDQYNQDEYNNYYKQETEGAEIAGYDSNEGGLLKKAIIFLGLIALGIAGYFGFKIFNNSNSTVTKEKIVIKEEPTNTNTNTEQTEEDRSSQIIEKKVIETIEHNKAKIEKVAVNTEKTAKELEERTKAVEEKLEKTIQKEVATQVQEKLQNNKKMSSEDISKIVNIVMSKMEKEKVVNTQTNKDHALLSALEKSNEAISNTEPKETKVEQTLSTTVVSSVKEANSDVQTNNKVTVEKNTQEQDTDLTKLSEQIKKLLNMAGETTTSQQTTTQTVTPVKVNSKTESNNITNYENSISQEIEVRKNEMRIIVVQPGDTLNKIAKRAYGDANYYQKIFDANPDISRADKIYVGQKLRIPE